MSDGELLADVHVYEWYVVLGVSSAWQQALTLLSVGFPLMAFVAGTVPTFGILREE